MTWPSNHHCSFLFLSSLDWDWGEKMDKDPSLGEVARLDSVN
jgi:hypothetical protein